MIVTVIKKIHSYYFLVGCSGLAAGGGVTGTGTVLPGKYNTPGWPQAVKERLISRSKNLAKFIVIRVIFGFK